MLWTVVFRCRNMSVSKSYSENPVVNVLLSFRCCSLRWLDMVPFPRLMSETDACVFCCVLLCSFLMCTSACVFAPGQLAARASVTHVGRLRVCTNLHAISNSMTRPPLPPLTSVSNFVFAHSCRPQVQDREAQEAQRLLNRARVALKYLEVWLRRYRYCGPDI